MSEDRDISAVIALPLRVVRIEGGYCLEDADKRVLAYHYARDRQYFASQEFDWPEARSIAQAVARALANMAQQAG